MKRQKMNQTERELISSMKLVLEDLKGNKPKGMITIWESAAAAEVKKARSAVHASQGAFAKLLRVSPKSVQAWEQGSKPPSGPATTWIRFILKDPKMASKALMIAHA